MLNFLFAREAKREDDTRTLDTGNWFPWLAAASILRYEIIMLHGESAQNSLIASGDLSKLANKARLS